ncbi:glycogen debranching protein GlgX [Tessaracoccus sp. OH4464_COT-324]|uniref:glycogen debranching protein GlgX n=1 Tax=Tessaracoccus sp. OH4464_COT-324 TaxID=2491059 RepID=UPI000F63163C|nr:glycogen debranching protein GlgX [Tessaracoccus sp. OH4464_COT-324]RRD47907.1 glycogen debranching enzyme GlgX [Tessaracoccus sp. OH4464_COT-324]
MSNAITDAPLGAHLTDDGVRFSLWAPSAESVELILVGHRSTPDTIPMERKSDGCWHRFVPGIGAGQQYGYRVHGEWSPENGSRFNSQKLLLDPYARAISGGVDFRADIRAYRSDAPHQLDLNDSLGHVPLSVVVANTPAPTPIRRRRPMSETVIYELHLRGFTRLHPYVPDHLRGSYLGLAYPDVIAYLKDLGVTAVELLPVHHFVSEPFVALKGLRNYWGYNTLSFFAPHAMYKAPGMLADQVTQFKEMVSALHENDIEVLLDVVYNHTAEGGIDGPSLNFRGIAQSDYYRMGQGNQSDYDVTGCGNSLNTAKPMVRRLIQDSLRYWVKEMGVDGFRFDLATTLYRDENHHVAHNHPMRELIDNDPELADIKLIAEPWDIGPFGYQVGAFGPRWSEWNDKFRDSMRDFWRGQATGVRELATRLAGSADIYDRPGRGPHSTINFITAHDGFTMRDLVSYDVKHNQANGESNRDGTDNNRSWNHGWEGETEDESINRLRRRQVKNLMASQILAVGTPMLVAGDEFGRTQGGNNNSYCQDSPVSWVDWRISPEWASVRSAVKSLLQLRSDHPALRRTDYRYHSELTDADGEPLHRIDLTWVDVDGNLMSPDAWADDTRKTLGMYCSEVDEAFLIYFNAAAVDIPLTLPGTQMGRSYAVAWSSCAEDELPPGPYLSRQALDLPARSVLVLRADVASSAAELAEWLAVEQTARPDTQ